MVTIKDIAKLAGVSYVSVSKALNDEPGVSEKTRQRVKAIAKEMNYTPNLAARRLVNKQTNYVGLIWPSTKGLFFYELHLQLHKEGLKRGYNVVVSMGEPAEALRVFNQIFADYVIHWNSSVWVPSMEFIKEKERFRGEMLIVGGGKLEEAHRLDVDRYSGIYQAVTHLAEKGHRRIAFVGGNNNKMEGYIAAGADLKLDIRPEFIIHPFDKLLSQKLQQILLAEEKPTALVVDSHGAYFNTTKILRSCKVDIPNDLELVIYDDIPEKELFDIPFTNVGVSGQLLAERAFDILTGEIKPDGDAKWVNDIVETRQKYYSNKEE